MASDGVKDMEGVTYGTDVDAGQSRLLVHWEEGGRMAE